MKRLAYLIVGVILFSACNNTSNQFEIKGTITDTESKKIVLNELLVSGVQFIDSIKIKTDGSFKIKSITDMPRFYQLAVSNTNFITLLVEPGESITIDASAKKLTKAKITGSEGSLLVQDITNQLIDTKKKLNKVIKSIEATEESDQKKINELNAKYAEIVNAQRDSSIAFIVRNLNSLASIVALYQKYDDKNFILYKNRDIQYIKIVSEALANKYPESEHVKSLIANKKDLLERYNKVVSDSKLSNIVTQQGTVMNIPEIYLPNTTGDSISLNSIKSKYILLNFWASWSEESLKRNLIYKEVYKKYHAKGFEIYQVSLDTKVENWKRAIQFDQLPGINVIDLNGRMSYFAKIYNVRKLPTSFLINPEREIIIANPSKEQLTSTFDYNLK